MLRKSCLTGFFPLIVDFTFLRYVFILISTPVIVPCTTVPFLSSIVTVSLFNFIKNLYEYEYIVIKIVYQAFERDQKEGGGRQRLIKVENRDFAPSATMHVCTISGIFHNPKRLTYLTSFMTNYDLTSIAK